MVTVLAVGAVASAPLAAADGSLAALTSQRTTLQAHVGQLSADQAAAVQGLLQVQDRLGNLRRQVAQNQAQLAGLEQRRADLEAKIAAARSGLISQRVALGQLARQQYKSRDQNTPEQVLFGSANLNQVVNRAVANRAVSDREHTMLSELRSVEGELMSQTADLARREAEVNHLQAELSARRAALQAAAADYHQRISSLDASSSDLLGQINSLNSQIAAATHPPARAYGQSQQQVIAIIRAAAARYGQDGNRLVRVANCESSLNPRAYDAGSGASGLFQFMPGTFYGNGGHDIWDATDQSNIAAKMFSQGRAGDWSCS